MAIAKRRKTQFPGVYVRDHATRKFNGHRDRCFDVSYKYNSRKIWEKVGWTSQGYTAAKAAIVRSERMRTIRHGEELPQRKAAITLAEVWKDYQPYLDKHLSIHAKDSTIAYYHKNLQPFERVYISDINEKWINRIVENMRGKSPGTITHILGLLQRLIDSAIKQGKYSGENPMRSYKKPSLRGTNRERFLTRAEADQLLIAAKKMDDRIYGAILISLETGMRQSEVLNLTPNRVDLVSGIMFILDTKNGENRKAYITPKVQEYLEHAMKDIGVSEKIINIRKEFLSNHFKMLVYKLGFNEDVTDRRMQVVFHTLRHTFASWLAQNGEPLQVIMELMGHKSIRMTLRYAYLIPDQKQEAIKKLFNGAQQADQTNVPRNTLNSEPVSLLA